MPKTKVELGAAERERRFTLTLEIQRRLEERYGMAARHARIDPLDELVACILSQHTSDINSFRAFALLKKAYPVWDLVTQASTEVLADTIRCGGLANSKAVRIQAVLRRIREEHGAFTLDFLATLSDADARAYLMSLPGVGPKTAAIVLCFALDRPVLPVDTHIFRVSWRLGLIEKRIGEAKAHDALQAQIRPEQVYPFHVMLITHGRQVCKAPAPRCPDCPLTDLCRYYAETLTPRPPLPTTGEGETKFEPHRPSKPVTPSEKMKAPSPLPLLAEGRG